MPGWSFVCTDIFVFYCNVVSDNLYLLNTLVGDCPRYDIWQKKLRCRIFRPKILNRKFFRITSVSVIRTQRMCCLWRNIHCWQKFYTAAGTRTAGTWQISPLRLSLKLLQSFLNLISPKYVLNRQSPINIHYMLWTPTLITSLKAEYIWRDCWSGKGKMYQEGEKWDEKKPTNVH